MKIVSQRCEQGRQVYDGKVFEAKREIPIQMYTLNVCYFPGPDRVLGLSAPVNPVLENNELRVKNLMKRFLAVLTAAILWLAGAAPRLWGQAVPTFVGVRTFLGTPYVTNLDDLHADFAVLGVPFDEGTWGWPGERYGPRAMRESSQEYNHDLTEGFYYIDGDRTVLKGKHWVDVGDVPIMPTVPSQTDDKITEMVRKIRSKGAFPIVLGGDHSITFPVLRAFDIPVTVIHFDAHLDTWNGAPGNLDHASWVNRAVELPNIKKRDSTGAAWSSQR